MSHVVAKPFNTVNRRLGEGALVSETDDLSPFTFDDLKSRRWIVSDTTKTGAAAVRKGSKAAAVDAEIQAAATQADLQREWQDNTGTGNTPEGQWVIHIEDADLYGRVVLQEGAAIGIDVPGEATRFYRTDNLDLDKRTISGRFSDHSGGPVSRRSR